MTRAVTRLSEGGIVGIRGPFGRGWPLEQLEGRDVVIVGGGIGLAPLRPVIYWLLRHRQHYRRLILLYGCRTPADRLYADQLEQWSAREDIDVLVTVDNATPGWVGPVGVVTRLLQRTKAAAGIANMGPNLSARTVRFFASMKSPTSSATRRCSHGRTASIHSPNQTETRRLQIFQLRRLPTGNSQS